jgi:hypothetical protein
MTHSEKLEKLKSFDNENSFRLFLIDLLKKMGFNDVTHTHRYGSPEEGKDIIARYHHALEGDDWYSFVVKYGRIGGGTVEIETIKGQIKQSFEYPYYGPSQSPIKINKVKVVTNENFTGGAQQSLNSSSELKSYNNFGYWWSEQLIKNIDEYYSDFWLPGDVFSKEYSRRFSDKLNAEIGIRELSIRKIDDVKIQKLLDIFVEPHLTTSEINEDKETKEKSIKRKNLSLNSFSSIKENLVLAGDQGSGKTKVINTIACNLATPEKINSSKEIPIRLKATSIRDNDFKLTESIEKEVKELSGDFFMASYLQTYKPILFIDDFDLLNKADKVQLAELLKIFCEEHKSHYVVTYRQNEFTYDKNIKRVRIHNFNFKQIQSFISKYFEGSDRGDSFIRILRESDLLSKLPTTPLTITLISLLYDENNFEIPATLSDIYLDFTNILLGKLQVHNSKELLVFNLKRRIFTALGLKMLDEKKFEIPFSEFDEFVNDLLVSRGYALQSEEDLSEIINNSSLLYKNDNGKVGFKQQAFIEFFASLEIYHHSRDTYYQKLLSNFNDVSWQNAAIFYAGHSKELTGMIDDIIKFSPAEDLKDWFVVSGGMGYLSQALYQTKPEERKKLVYKSIEYLQRSIGELKLQSMDKESFYYEMPLPLILTIVNYWFVNNFKSITLKSTLNISFEELSKTFPDSTEPEFDNNFKMLMIASALMNPNIGDEVAIESLIERNGFMNHPILPLIADLAINLNEFGKNKADKSLREKLQKQLEKKRYYIRAILKNPAYKLSDDFHFEENKSLSLKK